MGPRLSHFCWLITELPQPQEQQGDTNQAVPHTTLLSLSLLGTFTQE